MISRTLVLCLSLISTGIIAQVQITADDINNMLGTTVMFDFDTSDQIVVNVGEPGADQTYKMDQTFAALPALYTQSTISPNMAPNGSDFPDANLVMLVDFEDDSVSADIANYTRLESTGWTQLGSVSRFNAAGIDTVLIRTGEELIMPLPLTYGSTWSSSNTDTLEIIAGSSFISTSSKTHEVDGWGKIELPNGTFDCLRIKTEMIATSQVTFNGLPISNNSSSNIMYQWVDAANGSLAGVSSQNDETDPNFTIAASAGRIRSATTSALDHDVVRNLTIAPNPVIADQLSVQLDLEQGGEIHIRMLSTSGTVATSLFQGYATPGANSFDLALDSALPNGIYPLEIITSSGKSVRQVLLVR